MNHSVAVLLHHVAWTGGTIIIEIVVSVLPVFGKCILVECAVEQLLLRRCEIELLLHHLLTLGTVFIQEIGKRGHSQDIIGSPPHEIIDETGL